MFYCEPCGKKNGYPTWSPRRFLGPCELCGKTEGCFDVPSSQLPSSRKCLHCGQPDGKGPRELRPYGPNGEDVCAECTLGKNGTPERVEQAEQAFAKKFKEDWGSN